MILTTIAIAAEPLGKPRASGDDPAPALGALTVKR